MVICWSKIWKKREAKKGELVFGETLKITADFKNRNSTEKVKRTFSNFPDRNGKTKIIVKSMKRKKGPGKHPRLSTGIMKDFTLGIKMNWK